MTKLELGNLIFSPQECIEFIHMNYAGKRVLTSLNDAKIFLGVSRSYVEGLEGAMLFSPSVNVSAPGTYLAPAVIAAAAYFKGISSLELSAQIHAVVTAKYTDQGVRYYCGNNAVLLAFETNGVLEITSKTPIVFEAYIRQLFLAHRSQAAAVA